MPSNSVSRFWRRACRAAALTRTRLILWAWRLWLGFLVAVIERPGMRELSAWSAFWLVLAVTIVAGVLLMAGLMLAAEAAGVGR